MITRDKIARDKITRDKITRFLSGSDFTSADLWQLVKPLVRPIQSQEAVLVFDDSLEEKLYTDESELICWHWDRCFNRNSKGVNFLTCLYHAASNHTPTAALPVAFELIKKSEWTLNKKTNKPQRVCPKTKNEYLREMVTQCQKNQLPFRYVLADAWFSAAETMVFLTPLKPQAGLPHRLSVSAHPNKASRPTARSPSRKQTSQRDAISPFPR